MAQKVSVMLVDDLDGTTGDDVTTVTFGLDGVTYEIDLSGKNAGKLRAEFEPYLVNARRTGGRINRGTKGATASSGEHNKRVKMIREWAAGAGIALADRGRIPEHVIKQYDDAVAAAKPAKAPRKTVAAAKKSSPAKKKTSKEAGSSKPS